MSISDLKSTVKKFLADRNSAVVNPDDYSGEEKEIAEIIAELMTTIREDEKMNRALQRRADLFVTDNPQGIAVLAPDKHRLDLNKEYERIWHGTYDELMAKKLYDFNIEVTGDDFYKSFETKKKAVSDMKIKWEDGSYSYLRLFQTPILNEEGEIDVNYYIYQDLTEMKEQIESNKALQRRAELFVTDNPQGIAVLAPDKHRLDLNKEYERIWHGTYDELMAKKLYDFNIEVTGDDFYKSFETKKKAVTDMKIKWEDGSFSYLRLFQTPILNDNGEIDVNYYIYQDLTEITEQLESIKTLQQRTDAIVQENPMPIVIWNTDLKAEVTNKAFLKLSGYTPEEAANLTIKDMVYLKQAGKSVKETIETKTASHGEAAVRFPSGDKDVERYNIPLLTAAGKVDSILSVYNDITELRKEIDNSARLQKRAEAFVKNNPQGIAVLAADKHRLDLNKQYEKIWHGSYDELMAKKLYDFDVEVSGADFYESFNSKKNEVSDMTVKWEDGTKSYLRLFQTPIVDDKGEIDVNYYIYQDRTPEVTQSEYMDVHVQRIAASLEALATGNKDGLQIDVNDADTYTKEMRAQFLEIFDSVQRLRQVLAGVISDIEKLANAGIDGKLEYRIDADIYQGLFNLLGQDLNKLMEAVATPLNEAMQISEFYAAGDFSARFSEDIAVKGDFDKFKQSLNNIGEKVSENVRESNKVTMQVSQTSGEIIKGTDEIAKAAESVAGASQRAADLTTALFQSIEEISNQISDLSASNEEIASTSQEVFNAANQVVDIGKEAQSLGNDANIKMNNVEKIASGSVQSISELSEKIKEVSNVVRMINAIAGQINLLALNAAIEAARAGEHGRGFAVVAGEVKNLAAEARAATETIESVVSVVQTSSEKTAEAIIAANKEIVEGVDSVNKTIVALNTIIAKSGQVTNDIGEITRAIEDQANISNNIVKAADIGTQKTREVQKETEELAALAEEESASIEEISSAIHEVGNLVKNLENANAKFKC